MAHIVGEFLQIGIKVCESTVEKYMVRHPTPSLPRRSSTSPDGLDSGLGGSPLCYPRTAMLDSFEGRGLCPNCDLHGPVGAACGSAGCRKRGYHFIPTRYGDEPGEPDDPMVGCRIVDYLIVGVLGQGGFGKVYRALQLPIGLPAALKLLRPDRVGSGERVVLEKFEAEARALARLAHPNIVRLLKYGEAEGKPYLVMEFVEGGVTLRERLKRRGSRMALSEVIPIMTQVLDGLEAAHERGIVHRDIKPGNIMLQPLGRDQLHVRILDFGLAKLLYRGRSTNSMIAGTPAYMAPELATSSHVGPSADLYAVGVMIVEALTGARPFRGRTPAEGAQLITDPDYDPVEALRLDVLPNGIRTVLQRALSPDPARRYQSSGEMRDELVRVSSDPEPSVRSPEREVTEPDDESTAWRGGLATHTEPASDTCTQLDETEAIGRSGIGSKEARAALWVFAGALFGLLALTLLWQAPTRLESQAWVWGPELEAPVGPPPPQGEVETPRACRPVAGYPTSVRNAFGHCEYGPGDKDDVWVNVPAAPGEGFWIGKFEVTVAQYQACVEAKACPPRPELGGPTGDEGDLSWVLNNERSPPNPLLPQNALTFDQADNVCGWLRGRVPTAEEWRAAFTGAKPPAAAMSHAVAGANLVSRAPRPVSAESNGASACGALDMVGNVWEWTSTQVSAPTAEDRRKRFRWYRILGGYFATRVEGGAPPGVQPGRSESTVAGTHTSGSGACGPTAADASVASKSRRSGAPRFQSVLLVAELGRPTAPS